MTNDYLVPVDGAWVRRKDGDMIGVVKTSRKNGQRTELHVAWPATNASEWIDLKEVRSGIKIGMEVQDVPWSRTRKSLGEGIVIETRRLGEREQVLVEFLHTGQRVWLPYENLRQIKGALHRFTLGQIGPPGHAERFRLHNLAHALEMWNENTGSLSQLDIDPLPHQIHLVHHILASGNLNWLIADDVGLGKTIEVGMLLAALRQRGTYRRVLLVTPAGLVNQWKDALYHKFGMSDFMIYGEDFRINEPRAWKMYDHVIGSMDRFKSENHLETLLQAGTWDLIVFDEAHRLSRRQWGSKYESAERFKLAALLRKKTDALLLLSGTPHQGMQDKFQALLELLRPELKTEIQSLAAHPEIIRQMVIRNHKADVTDVDGNFIFQGKITSAIQVPFGDEQDAFDRALQKYLREGYAAGKRKGKTGLAIGFVMNAYRKLAASSIAAIRASLQRRLERLQGEYELQHSITNDEQTSDERFLGEVEEKESRNTPPEEFFSGEIQMVKDLLTKADAVLTADTKVLSFTNNLLKQIHSKTPDEKVLVFTEYRSTQDYLSNALAAIYGRDAVSLINGGQTYQEREQAIVDFEEKGKFLISTEAGSEGLNLQRQCHVMVNYDLPWNPMRLVQRVGRLYRYGQRNKVVVFNLHAPQSFDAKIMHLMYERISQVVVDMASVSEEFRAGLEDEIFGEISDMLDVEEILEDALNAGIERTQERIDEALRKARDAAEKQRELFAYAAGFDPEEAKGELAMGISHVQSFIDGMLRKLGVEIVELTHGGKVLDIRLPEELCDELGIRQQRWRITTDRDLAMSRQDIHMMDFHSPLLRHFLEKAKSYSFEGNSASIALKGRALVTAMLRWQNDQGMRMRQEFTAVLVGTNDKITVNSNEVSEWLLQPAVDTAERGNKEQAKAITDQINGALDRRLSQVSNTDLHPENRQILAAGWCSSVPISPAQAG